MKRLIISGASGRMGRQISSLCREYGFIPVAGIDVKTQEQNDFPFCSSYHACQQTADILIDFSLAAHLPQTVAFACQKSLPLLIGTTGLEAAHDRLIAQAAQRIPIMQSANYARGIKVLTKLSKAAAALLEDFDIEIIDRHHAQKADSPGGTAMMLAKEIGASGSSIIFGRNAALQKRSRHEIALHSLRGGTLCGTHEVGFYGSGEHLLLIHVAEDRTIFARGALQCARWLVSQQPGLYSPKDVQ